MRKVLAIGLVILLAVGAAGWALLARRDPIANARRLMARNDMRGAELYLRQATRAHPQSKVAAFLMGEVDLALGNPAAAELQLRRAADRGYDHAAILLPLGQAYLQQRHFEAALKDFDPGAGPPAERVDRLTIRAAAQLALGDAQAAQATIEQAQHAAPDAREVLLTVARVAVMRGDLDQAATAAHRILAHAPANLDARLMLADIALRRQDPQTALTAAQAILKTSPGLLDALLIEARAMAALGRSTPAREVLGRVLQATPRNVGANYLAAVLAVQDRDYTAADTCLTRIGPTIDQLPRGDYLLAVVKLGLDQPALAEEASAKFLAQQPDDVAGLKLAALIALARHQPAQALELLHRPPLAKQPDADALDIQGQAQAMAGQPEAARASFAEASRLAPRNTQLLNRLAASSFSLGDSGAAEAALRRSLQIAPDQTLAAQALVQAALARGDLAEATRDVARLRALSGDDEATGVLAAQVKLAALDMDGARAQLQDVLRRYPDSRAATLNLVRIDGLRGDGAAAEALLETRLRKHPDDQGALDLLLPALLAEQHFDQAVAVAEAAHGAAPNSAGIIAALAGTYVRAHQPDRAAALLDRASAENPQLLSLRARILSASGHADQAERVYRDILARNPGDARVRADLGALLAQASRFDDARAELHAGLEQAPGNPVLLAALVSVGLRQGGIHQALADAAALRADPANLPAARVLDGEAWLAAGDRAQAANAFLAAFRAAPSSELAARAASSMQASGQADKAVALLSSWTAEHPKDLAAQSILSSLYISANRLDDAVSHLGAVLAAQPDDAAALNNLAWVKQQQGDMASALALAERAYFEAPSPTVADTLGWILARGNDTGRALPLLAQAASAGSGATRAEAEYHYGIALKTAGRADDARTQLRRAVEAPAGFAEKEDARRVLEGLK